MNRQQVARGANWTGLGAYVLAGGMAVYSAVVGVILAVRTSVIGGIAVVFLAFILGGMVAWRIRFAWQRARGSSSRTCLDTDMAA